MIKNFKKLKILVIGETIIDQYVFCEALGKSGKEPVLVLRDFRDRILLKSKTGQLFVKYYYKYSPNFVKLTKDIKIIHKIFRNILKGIIKLLKGSK